MEPNKFLFILSPPFGGSSVLTQIIASSQNVSLNNPNGTCEGQQLPGVRKIMFEDPDRWNPKRKYPWPFIRKEWMKAWDLTKPILLEKSPPNLVRLNQIARHFSPLFLICMVREPFSNAEGLIRRTQMEPSRAAHFVLRCMLHQRRNIEMLENVVSLTYEELTDNPEQVKERIIRLLPELQDINHEMVFRPHNFKAKKMKLTNLNEEKLRKLDPATMKTMRKVFRKGQDVLNYFGYTLDPLAEGARENAK